MGYGSTVQKLSLDWHGGAWGRVWDILSTPQLGHSLDLCIEVDALQFEVGNENIWASQTARPQFPLNVPTYPRQPASQHTVAETPGKPAWPKHILHSGGMSLSANDSSSLMFTNAFDGMLIFMRFWKAGPHFWNHMGCWEAVNQSCCVLHSGAVGKEANMAAPMAFACQWVSLI